MNEDTKTPETVSEDDLDQAQGGLILNLSVGVKDGPDTAEFTNNPTRFDPYKNFKFR